jgi:hypothetical protein
VKGLREITETQDNLSFVRDLKQDLSNATHFRRVASSQSLPPKPTDGVAVMI